MTTVKQAYYDLVNFTISQVNSSISFQPQKAIEVPATEYESLKEEYTQYTGTAIRRNKSKLYFLPTNVNDDLHRADISYITSSNQTAYINKLITELDYGNIKRVELACVHVCFAAVNRVFELQPEEELQTYDDNGEPVASKRGGVLGFRELGVLVDITPWHFHRVFKVVTGLTIREYGQLCLEFIEQNKNVYTSTLERIHQLRMAGDDYVSTNDKSFLESVEEITYVEDPSFFLASTSHFIDPSKSKEFKKNLKEKTEASKAEAPEYEGSKPRRDSRKKRHSVLSGRVRKLEGNISIGAITPKTPESASASPTGLVGSFVPRRGSIATSPNLGKVSKTAHRRQSSYFSPETNMKNVVLMSQEQGFAPLRRPSVPNNFQFAPTSDISDEDLAEPVATQYAPQNNFSYGFPAQTDYMFYNSAPVRLPSSEALESLDAFSQTESPSQPQSLPSFQFNNYRFDNQLDSAPVSDPLLSAQAEMAGESHWNSMIARDTTGLEMAPTDFVQSHYGSMPTEMVDQGRGWSIGSRMNEQVSNWQNFGI